MATANFDITPEELKASANRIEGKVAEFTNAYKSIYTAVSDLRVTYAGRASDEFNQRIEGYRNDFSAVETTLKKYIDFLRWYAENSQSVEDSIESSARTLPTGR